MIDEDKIRISVKCKNCGEIHNLRVRPMDLKDWAEGNKLVQEAFPYLSPAQRELLLTQICPECWDAMFGRYE